MDKYVRFSESPIIKSDELALEQWNLAMSIRQRTVIKFACVLCVWNRFDVEIGKWGSDYILTAFLGTADSEVHIVHISRVEIGKMPNNGLK